MRRLVSQRYQHSIVRTPITKPFPKAASSRRYSHQDSHTRPRNTCPRALDLTNSRKTRPSSHSTSHLQSSVSTSLFAIAAAGLCVVTFLYCAESIDHLEHSKLDTESLEEQRTHSQTGTPDYSTMPIPQGFLGNLNADQEARLKEFWSVVLKTFGVPDADADVHTPTTPIKASVPEPTSAKKDKHSLFHRKNKSAAGSPGSPGRGSDPEDKYGQASELQFILGSTSPQVLHDAFWSMVKKDHPDALLLRFLRARKWDVQKALAMLVSTMHWRANEMHLDDDIMRTGEAGALEESQSPDPAARKEGTDFLTQMRLGKSFMHGVDKEGRPICIVRVRLHKSGEQSERSLERYTVYTIETTRLAMQPPVETGTILFDMTSFTMANMDYTPVKFMIKVFEANYPESLGSVLVHKAPWIFQGVWKIIRGWLDPVVAAKVHFTNNVEDLTAYIDKSRVIKELGGDEDWEYQYIEPVAGENEEMKKDSDTRVRLEQEQRRDIESYEKTTFDWIRGADVKADRDNIAQRLQIIYWQLDPFIRARSLYDRQGLIGKDGRLNFYPSKASLQAAPLINGAPPRVEASEDDVD